MNRVYVRDFCSADHCRNIQIALRQLRRPNADRLVGKPHWQRVTIGLTVNCNRADPKFLARADHAQCNFSAVGDQYLLEHSQSAFSSRLSAPSLRAQWLEKSGGGFHSDLRFTSSV